MITLCFYISGMVRKDHIKDLIKDRSKEYAALGLEPVAAGETLSDEKLDSVISKGEFCAIYSQYQEAETRAWYLVESTDGESIRSLRRQKCVAFLNEICAKTLHFDDAEEFDRALLAREHRAHGTDSLNAIGLLNTLGTLCRANHHDSAAELYFSGALKACERHADEISAIRPVASNGDTSCWGISDSLRVDALAPFRSLVGLGDSCQSQRHYARAQNYYSRALAIGEKQMGVNYFELASVVYDQGACARAMGDLKLAESKWKRCLQIGNSSHCGPVLLCCQRDYVALLMDEHRLKEAAALKVEPIGCWLTDQ
jgi:tetratricopeptide (TPR) repeat protein